MIRPFVFVTVRSFRNRIVSRLKRLRNIRYLVSFLAGMAYLWFTSLRHLFGPHSPLQRVGIPVSPLFVDLAAALVLAMMILAWALPEQSAGLTFSEAEIQFLFPAPITRRQLLLYKILRAQPQVFLSATLMTIFVFRSAKFIGLWSCFIVLSIYFTFVALGRARLKLLGIGFLIRLPAVAAIVVGVSYLLWHTVDLTPFHGMGKQMRPGHFPNLPSLFHGRVADAILFVPRLFAHAVLPHTIPQLLASCGALIVVALVFLELAARTNIAFEEASIHASQKSAARRARMNEQRIGKQVTFPRIPPPFRIPARAKPEVAIYWKNVTAGLRISSPWLLIMLACALYFLGQAFYASDDSVRIAMASIALFTAAMFPFLGSAVFSQDMRLDLPRIELLKSYPISGERLVAAEIAGPLTFIAAVEIVMLSVASIIMNSAHMPKKLNLLATPQFVVIALIIATPVCAAQLLIRNSVPILLPGWAMRAPDEQRGFIVLGQRLLMTAGNLLVLLFVLLPAACIVGPGLLMAKYWFHDSVAVVAFTTVIAAALLFFEVWLGIQFLGRQFEKIDVTNELDTVAS
ncbi:MAG TPA: putative ABC exporter domain-containing protein [Thermoanaerobaculia bacterium]|nr:putative ABC exporter domain-containing protein [Thermoanaerobaculia bacterium]